MYIWHIICYNWSYMEEHMGEFYEDKDQDIYKSIFDSGGIFHDVSCTIGA